MSDTRSNAVSELNGWNRRVRFVVVIVTALAASLVAVAQPGSALTGAASSELGPNDCALVALSDERCEIWATTYERSDNDDALFPGERGPEGVAVSPDGSTVFVVGPSDDTAGLNLNSSNSNYATVAYDAASGEQLWAATYRGDGSSDPRDIAVGPQGARVFVTGRTADNPDANWEFATVAYDTVTGEELWAARSATPDADARAEAITVSEDGSRIYVAGRTGEGGPNSLTLIAYDAATGVPRWTAQYEGINRFEGVPLMVAVAPGIEDGVERVLVSATTQTGTHSAPGDYLTVAFDGVSGQQLWERRWAGASGDFHSPEAIAVAPTATHVYVTGTSDGTPGGDSQRKDWATVAYDVVTGTQQWVARYAGPPERYTEGSGNRNDVANDVLVGADGSTVYVVGRSNGAQAGETRWDNAVVAYDAWSGEQRWASGYNSGGADTVFDAALSPTSDRLYVAGARRPTGGATLSGWEMQTVAFDTGSGETAWLARYRTTIEHPQGSLRPPAQPPLLLAVNSARAVTVNPTDGTVYVAGWTQRLALNPQAPRGTFGFVTLAYEP